MCIAPEQARPSVPAPARGSILVVDDDPMVRDVTGRLLQRLGYTPILAGDGAEALWLVGHGLPDLRGALIDFTMPLMHGGEVAAAIQALRPGTPVVIMSGYPGDGIPLRLGQHGLRYLLQKPFSAAELEAALALALQPA